MKILKNIFRRKEKSGLQPLRIEGVPPAPMTAEPDDAELAAQALLEHMAALNHHKRSEHRNSDTSKGRQTKEPDAPHDAAYYHALADRIRQAHDSARLRTMRFVAFCEQELKKAELPLEGPGSLGLLNAELMKRIDTVEREGGDLKRRWQHCVAEVTVRLMQAGPKLSVEDNTDTITKTSD